MPLANYTTVVSVERSVEQIMKLLKTHGAIEINTSYNAQGEVIALKWLVKTQHGDLAFRMPVDVRSTHQVLLQQHHLGKIKGTRFPTEAQARKVAWRIMYDWTRVQMALLETKMVTLEQIFLPYMLVGANQTLYERAIETAFNFKALPEGKV